MLKYKRVLLKLSGEVFGGDAGDGIQEEVLLKLANALKGLQEKGVALAVVIGGGNFWRYRDFKSMKLSRVASDNIGMLATIMNALAFESALEAVGAKVRALSSFPCNKALEEYTIKRAKQYLDKGKIVICAGGTGSPFFTTDSAAALRALELEVDVLLKATKVDFVYDKDPMKFKDAKKYTNMSFALVIEKQLAVMDLTCAALMQAGKIPMVVFNLKKSGNIGKVLKGEKVGTIIN